MGLFLHIEIKSPLSPTKFHEGVVAPLQEALARENLGRLVDDNPKEVETPDGVYELALEVRDVARARELVEEVLEAVDGRLGLGTVADGDGNGLAG